ncbi:MAG: hypothetical protein RRC34_14175 [Lentisphaeria bacterium]|nr:hypothetical protein [Lentisphaeria bacterium]
MNSTRPKHVLLIMLDGVGWPETALENSIYADCPALLRLFQRHAVPVDTCLNVPGLPQSATGQTAILTGVNAAAELGSHLHGFPNARLRDIIEQNNLFIQLRDQGVRADFANAYALKPEQALGTAVRSVTTVAVTSAYGKTRTREHLFAGQAVYHDLTRSWLAEKEQAPVPLVSEETAADHLLAIMRTLDFCLFEFFLTDVIGHRGTLAEKQAVLASLDRFFDRIMSRLNPTVELLLVVSDHGNIEEPDHKRHTANPVPFCAFGYQEQRAREGVTSLTDVTPRVISLFEQ